MDTQRAATHFGLFLDALGVDVENPHLVATPDRVVRMYQELLTPNLDWKPTVFDNDGEYDSLVILKEIPFYTLCEHHVIPFFGMAHVGYLPDSKVIGLSKMARIVEHFARRLQNQERMTAQIAREVEEITGSSAVATVLQARHLCAEMRGVKKPGMVTQTRTMLGDMRENASLKDEFMDALRG